MKTRIFLEGENLLEFIEEHVVFGKSSQDCHSCACRNPELLDSGINPEGHEQDSVTSTEGQGQKQDFSLHSKGQKLQGQEQRQDSGTSTEGQGQKQDFSLHSGGYNPQKLGLLHASQGQKLLLQDGDILVITSKVVALAEGRTFVARDEAEKLSHVIEESIFYARTKYVHLTMKDGIPMAIAGIDESNGDGKCIMLPRDSYESAYEIWHYLREKYHLEHLGIIITDSHTVPFRKGTTGISLGHMGFSGVKSYIGEHDIFGRPFVFSKANIVDALATAAVHTMGEGDESQPLAIIRDPRVTYTQERQNGDDLIIDPEDDMYGPIFSFAQTRI